jgi:hypothetical protein
MRKNDLQLALAIVIFCFVAFQISLSMVERIGVVAFIIELVALLSIGTVILLHEMKLPKLPKMVKVKCKVCGNTYKCAEGSIGEANQMCAKCWALTQTMNMPANAKDALKRVQDLIKHPEKGEIKDE